MNIFFERKGKPSLKRISGSIMLVNGLVGKNVLMGFAFFKEITSYQMIDDTLDTMIWGGIALLTGTIFDKFFRKKD